ncbi:MAG: prephenate dehydrogenase [Ardenticatenales bacterium]|nr:prephenate dehydrogenase [Ardenticatenales bacterium]
MTIKVTIIGLDPLGQSIGLALKSGAPTMTVIAHDREHSRAGEAVKLGAADSAEWNLLAAIDGTDLVFLNEPIYHIKETLELLGRELRKDAVITDTSSVKQHILAWAAELPPTVHFVGSTPLVNARKPSATLFQKQRYAVLPLPQTPEAAVRLVTNAIELMGAELLFMEPAEHDALMASVLHLPAVMSAALLQLTTRSNSWREMAALAGPAYARMSALPATSPQNMATQLRYNREPLLHWLGALREELGALETLLTQNDEGIALEAHLAALLEAQARWRKAEVENPENEAYDSVMTEVKETGGMRRFLNFGRKKKDGG